MKREHSNGRSLGLVTVVVALVASSCSGGDDDAADAEPAATSIEAAGPEATAAPDAPDESDNAAESAPAAEREPVLEVFAPVVDPDAETRCEMMGYPCSWGDAPPSAMAESFTLLEQTRAMMIDAGLPWDAVEAAALALSVDERVVEVLPDLEGFTGILFRLEGAPPVFLDTELAGPIGEEIDRERVELSAETAEAITLQGAPVGFRMAAPERYHPVGGPLNSRTAVIVEPYASTDADCDTISVGNVFNGEWPVNFSECRQTWDGLTEGAAVAAIFRSRPDDYTQVTHLTDFQATPAAISAAIAGADAVHIATHGSANCRNAQPTEELSPQLQPADYDASKCYSQMALAPLTAEEKTLARNGTLTAPPGSSFSDHRWWATPDFVAKAMPNDAILFGSHCTSADGQLGGAGLAGVVGWHKYARISSAVDAALRFWELMVTDGVEFDVAYSTLQDENLHRSGVTNRDEHIALAQTATLVAGGTNPRARDVVTTKIDGAELGGQVLKVRGMPGDTAGETFPAHEQELTFELEGVKTGTADSVTIDVYWDGKKLKSDIELKRDGTITESDEFWDDWRVTVKPDAVELDPTTAADFAPNKEFRLEVRAYERSSRYTADAGQVRLGTRLASSGPLPIFEELETTIASTGGTVTGNDLRIEFDTAGGAVTGELHVVMSAQGFDIGNWDVQLAGTYDPETERMTGTLEGSARGEILFISAGDSGTGEWFANVDLDAATVTGTLGAGAGSQPYNGKIEAIS